MLRRDDSGRASALRGACKGGGWVAIVAAIACGSSAASTSSASSSSSSAASSSSGAAASSSGSSSSSSGTGGAGGAAFTPGPHEPFPKVTSLGGPVLAHPDLVTIVFAGDVHDATMKDYATWIAGSSWLTTAGADYGVGAGSHATHVVLQQQAPTKASNADTITLLEGLVAAKTVPAPTPDTLYVLLYPSTTTITDFEDRPNCAVDANGMGTLGGYHWEAGSGASKFAFAVLPTCSTGKDADIYLEVSASHEIIEAATDPFPLTAPGWVLGDLTSAWSAALTGEVGDLCEFLTWSNDNGHWAQPAWSTSSAAKGESPCLPAGPAPYYNSSLTPSKVQHVKAGGSVMLEVRGWSTAPSKPWALSTLAYGDFQPITKLGKTMLDNDQTTTLEIDVPADAKPGQTADVLLVSTRSQATRDLTVWPASIVVAP